MATKAAKIIYCHSLLSFFSFNNRDHIISRKGGFCLLGSLCATYNMKPQFSSFLDCKHYCNILFFYQNPVSIYLTFTAIIIAVNAATHGNDGSFEGKSEESITALYLMHLILQG